MPVLTPFKDWAESNPTELLSWFAAYNKLKHDKHNNQCLATMGNALNAAAAYYAVALATIGNKLVPGFFNDDDFFGVTFPQWRYDDVYYPIPEQIWSSIPFDL